MTSQQRQELERKKFLKTKPTFQQNSPSTTEKIKYGIADVLGQGANNMNYLAGTIGKYGSNLPADVISMVSPKVANTIGDYSAGLLAPTSKEEWSKYNSKSQLNRANIAAEAVGNVLAGEVIGAGITKASPYIKKGISNVGKEVGERVRPYLVGESKIPMSGYKPVMNAMGYNNLSKWQLLENPLVPQNNELILANIKAKKGGENFKKLISSEGFKNRFADLTGKVPSNISSDVELISTKGDNTYIGSTSPFHYGQVSDVVKQEVEPFIKTNYPGIFYPKSSNIYIKANTENIPFVTSHELSHRVLDKSNAKIAIGSEGQDVPNPNWKHYNNFIDFAAGKFSNSPWGHSPEEHMGELWANRIEKQIPYDRNYTRQEAIDFINSQKRRLYGDIFKKEMNPSGQLVPNNRAEKAISFIQRFGATIPTIGVTKALLNQSNNKQ